jgi:hypothetical protein
MQRGVGMLNENKQAEGSHSRRASGGGGAAAITGDTITVAPHSSIASSVLLPLLFYAWSRSMHSRSMAQEAENQSTYTAWRPSLTPRLVRTAALMPHPFL